MSPDLYLRVHGWFTYNLSVLSDRFLVVQLGNIKISISISIRLDIKYLVGVFVEVHVTQVLPIEKSHSLTIIRGPVKNYSADFFRQRGGGVPPPPFR